jgi:hypothetical protein
MGPQAADLRLLKAKIADAGITGAALLAHEKLAE